MWHMLATHALRPACTAKAVASATSAEAGIRLQSPCGMMTSLDFSPIRASPLSAPSSSACMASWANMPCNQSQFKTITPLSNTSSADDV